MCIRDRCSGKSVGSEETRAMGTRHSRPSFHSLRVAAFAPSARTERRTVSPKDVYKRQGTNRWTDAKRMFEYGFALRGV